jgi:ABC-type Fe3+/spermidine/putrescine transport system ATPase subunit
MPYITVEENVGKFLSNMYPEEKKARVQDLLDMVEMTAFAKVNAKFLSGGQQQRVALEPEIIFNFDNSFVAKKQNPEINLISGFCIMFIFLTTYS